MIKEKFELKEHVVTERVLVERKLICDICGKEIKNGNGYWEVETHHNDWGNDSVESYEHFDVCSIECLKKKFDEYCDDSNYDYNTRQIEVEHTTWQHSMKG